jgi:hypothetical protein
MRASMADAGRRTDSGVVGVPGFPAWGAGRVEVLSARDEARLRTPALVHHRWRVGQGSGERRVVLRLHLATDLDVRQGNPRDRPPAARAARADVELVSREEIA